MYVFMITERRHSKQGQAKQNRVRTLVSLLLLLLAALALFWTWCWLLFAALAPGNSTTSLLPLAFVKKDEHESLPASNFGQPVYPLEIDDPKLQDAVATLKRNDKTQKTDAAASNLAYATVTRQSNQHAQNQDRATIYYPFRTTQSQPNVPAFLVCIFDGHGIQGHMVADYVVRAFPGRLSEKLNQQPIGASDEWIMQQLKNTFVEMEQEVPTEYSLTGGCTGSVTLRLGHRLFFANAGDSRTILGDYRGPDNVDIPFMTRKDKANLPDERARIEGLGGKIHIPPRNPNLSRVVVFSKAANPPEPIGLAMSRSIGDLEWSAVGVTPEPLVDVVDLSNLKRPFLVAASDGLWDLRRPQFFAKQFGASFYGDEDGEQPLVRSVETIRLVSPQNTEWYRDDISVVIVKL